jgi:DNA polymerase-3 subunit alpha
MYLNSHSFYSLKYGTLSPLALLELAAAQQVSHIALTDINNTSGCIDFCRQAKAKGIQPVIGIDFRNGIDCHYIGLAKNINGFAALNEHLTNLLYKRTVLEAAAPAMENVFIIYPFAKLDLIFTSRSKKHGLLENEFIGIHASELKRFLFSKWTHLKSRLVVLHPITYSSKRAFNMHRLLRAMDQNVLLSKLPLTEQAGMLEQFTPMADIRRAFADFPMVLQQTERLMAQCFVDFEFGVLKNRKTYFQSSEQDSVVLREAAYQGMRYRYPKQEKIIIERLENELKVINELGFNAYFLLNWDIINYAQHKDYFYVGRGSGANSIVAYCLKITDVDPIDLDLYFERFINAYRTSPPDFDLDFSWRDRDDITRYIFERFTQNRPNTVALIATYSTLKVKAVVRELGKVFGLPKVEIDQLLQGNQLTNKPNQYYRWIHQYGQYLEDFPSHLSVHAGGVLIAEKSMYHYTALSDPPKGFPLTQFSMLEAEDIGLYKFDILSQRGLGKIKEAIEIVRYNHPNDPPIDIHDIQRFKKDTRIKQMLKNAETMGCFYVESPAMRMLLQKLKAETYLALVAASSIIRPGVAKSGMMREYILRFHEPERMYNSPKEILEIMPETYGIMVYQEDVIKVAHYFAGLTLAESDVLRRGMSGKFRSREEFDKSKDKFLQNCVQRGHSKQLSEEIWRQIESFAGYAFSKGHSASYAVESYQCLFLKAYYPLEYMVATINNFGGFYGTEYYIHEARMHGAIIQPPNINKSCSYTVIEGKTIYLGLNLIKDLEQKTMDNLVREREKNGPFSSLQDFIDRVEISVDQLRILIRMDAFLFTERSKQTLLWDVHTYLGAQKKTHPAQELFSSHRTFTLPTLESDTTEEAFEAFELLGFPLCSPFDLLQEAIPTTTAADIPAHYQKNIQIAGYWVTTKYTGTTKGQHMYFGTFLDINGYWIDTVHFPPSAAAYPFRGKGCYLLEGKVVEEFGFFSIEVDKMKKLRWKF